MSDDVAFLSAEELVAAYRARRLSPVEVTETVLARIDRVNPVVNAFTTITADRAMEGARAAEAAPDVRLMLDFIERSQRSLVR